MGLPFKHILNGALAMCLLLPGPGYPHGPHSYGPLLEDLPGLHAIRSSFPDEVREFRVQLPVSYDANAFERYPVLYVLDADRPFVLQETINTINTLVDRHKMPELLIVFLANTSDEFRSRDYTPSRQADQFLDFLQFELIPYIDSRFRTEPLRILSGHSRSGLLTVYSLFDRPELFDAHIALSPALWHDDDQMIDQARSFFQAYDSLPNFLYMNIGGEENENISNAFQRMQFILRRMAPPDLDWRSDFATFESHGTTRPLGHYIALRKFFSNWDKPWNDIPTFDVFEEKGGLDMLLDRYQALSEEYGYTVKPVGLIDAGRYYLDIGDSGEAVRILNSNAEFYPGSLETYLLLSRVYESSGDRQSALTVLSTAESVAKSAGDVEGLTLIEEYRKSLDDF